MNALLQSIMRIAALTVKELLATLKDPRTLASLLVPPVIQCIVFGYAASYDLNNIPYALLDESRSAESRELVGRFDGSGIFERVVDLERAAAMQECLDNERVALVLVIGQNFGRDLEAGRPAPVQIICDGRNSNTASTALGYANGIVSEFNSDWRERNGAPSVPLAGEARAWYNANLETRWSMVPALIGTLTLLQTLLLASMSVAREREFGTFDQLLVTPMRPVEIMIGKTLPAALIGIVQATNVLLVAQLWFGIPFAGSYVPLYAGLILFLLAAVGMGLFVSSLASTMQQAMLYSFLLVMPFMLLSGLTTPVENMPDAIDWLTRLNPLRYAIDISRRVYLEGAGMEQIVPDLGALALIAVVTLGGSSWLFRRTLY
jgi:ABC-2 type transport system permease protein